MKSDTDGLDFSILKSSIDVISNLRLVLYFEYDVVFKQDGDHEALNTIKSLICIGYKYFIIYDNFGNYVISLSDQDIERFVDLNICLTSNRLRSGTPAIYYFDVCAFTEDDQDLFEGIRQLELAFVKRA